MWTCNGWNVFGQGQISQDDIHYLVVGMLSKQDGPVIVGTGCQVGPPQSAQDQPTYTTKDGRR